MDGAEMKTERLGTAWLASGDGIVGTSRPPDGRVLPFRRTRAALGIAALVACGPGAPHYGGGWTRGPALPEPVQEIQAAVLRGRIFIAGGFRTGDAASTAVYRLDPGAEHWDRVADLPEARHHMPLAMLNDSLYAIGGLGPDGFVAVATLWLYDPAADRWASRAPLPEPRGASAVAVVAGRIVVVGGMGVRGSLPDSIAIYDPGTDRWRHGAPVPTRGDHLAAAVVAGKVFAVGGRPLDPDRNFNRLEMYDPASDAWARLAPMPTARGGLAAVALGDRIHTFGGETNSRVFREHEVYDARAGTWSAAPPLPTPRHGLAAAVVGNRIYVIGGGPRSGLARTDVVEIYAPPAEIAPVEVGLLFPPPLIRTF
jgi:N-acetylneuraminic acid mutarotase